jgi:hypothetical protein
MARHLVNYATFRLHAIAYAAPLHQNYAMGEKMSSNYYTLEEPNDCACVDQNCPAHARTTKRSYESSWTAADITAITKKIKKN